ncbi:uncharacterized protein LOC119767117 [Culex quinquefasciatus]|uniref:uncharacterized protein LOC119767117 n=1 Tax=Culex quinquefasciatus TaxID=7176 RepID=UPI0018E2FAB5|nr:uncharacterized protein LOC119767117 [Culex quinquefasciatus]
MPLIHFIQYRRCSRFPCLSSSPESCRGSCQGTHEDYLTRFTKIRRFNLLYDVRSIYTRIRRTHPIVTQDAPEMSGSPAGMGPKHYKSPPHLHHPPSLNHQPQHGPPVVPVPKSELDDNRRCDEDGTYA